MKKVFTFSHPSLDFTYRDFPSREVAEQHRAEIGEDLEVPPTELDIESIEVTEKEFFELMDYAGFASNGSLTSHKILLIVGVES